MIHSNPIEPGGIGGRQGVWPNNPGTYALVLRLASLVHVQVGRLGAFALPAGWYVYVGSALGPGGLRGRLSRHFRQEKTLRWHIDYVLAQASTQSIDSQYETDSHERFHRRMPIAQVWYVESPVRWECVWAREVAALPGARVAVPGFGASDCGCACHLFGFEAFPPFETFARQVNTLGCEGVLRPLF